MTENNEKPHLGLGVVGHVDAGKSTTTGHLLYKFGQIDSRELEKMKKTAADLGKNSFEFAFFLDTQKAERERGITIQATAKEFFTDNYHYTIVDNPGHRDFVMNCFKGSSTVDAALLMIPAEKGGFEKAIAKGNRETNEVEGQTRQHSHIINLLGIKQVICCVNKMDDSTVEFSETRFNEIKEEAARMLARAGYGQGKYEKVLETIPFIPISGLKGYNLYGEKCPEMPWYKGFNVTVGDKQVTGFTVAEALDNYVQIPKRNDDKPARMPVSELRSIKGVGTIVTGRVEQGIFKPGDKVKFMPSGASGELFSIEMHHKSQLRAVTGDNVGLNVKCLDPTRMPHKGDVMMLASEPNVHEVYEFTAQVSVQNHPGQLKASDASGHGGFCPVVVVRTAQVSCRLYKINWRMGKSTNKQKVENAQFIEQGDTAEVVFRPTKPLYLESYDKCEPLARLGIMDSNNLVALGKVINVTYATPEVKAKIAAEEAAAREAKKAAMSGKKTVKK